MAGLPRAVLRRGQVSLRHPRRRRRPPGGDSGAAAMDGEGDGDAAGHQGTGKVRRLLPQPIPGGERLPSQVQVHGQVDLLLRHRRVPLSSSQNEYRLGAFIPRRLLPVHHRADAHVQQALPIQRLRQNSKDVGDGEVGVQGREEGREARSEVRDPAAEGVRHGGAHVAERRRAEHAPNGSADQVLPLPRHHCRPPGALPGVRQRHRRHNPRRHAVRARRHPPTRRRRREEVRAEDDRVQAVPHEAVTFPVPPLPDSFLTATHKLLPAQAIGPGSRQISAAKDSMNFSKKQKKKVIFFLSID